jgi:hypothetical protein
VKLVSISACQLVSLSARRGLGLAVQYEEIKILAMSQKAHQPDPIRLQVIWDFVAQEEAKSHYDRNVVYALHNVFVQAKDGIELIVPPPIPEIQFQEMIRAIDAEVEKRRQEKSQE